MRINNIYPKTNIIKKTPNAKQEQKPFEISKLCSSQYSPVYFGSRVSPVSLRNTDGNTILRKYWQLLQRNTDIPDVTLLHNSARSRQIAVILDTPRPFEDAMEYFGRLNRSKDLDELRDNSLRIKIGALNALHLDPIARKMPIYEDSLSDIQVKGVLGHGNNSIAFLILDKSGEYKVLKLSRKPSFPGKQQHIPELELPILGRFKDETSGIYGVLTPFAESAFIRFNPRKKEDIDAFRTLWEVFQTSIHQRGLKLDDCYPRDMRQFGFLGNRMYLLDFECIVGRELVH